MYADNSEERVMRLIRENKTSPEEIAIVNMQVRFFPVHFQPREFG
jgi:hypothetical protein